MESTGLLLRLGIGCGVPLAVDMAGSVDSSIVINLNAVEGRVMNETEGASEIEWGCTRSRCRSLMVRATRGFVAGIWTYLR